MKSKKASLLRTSWAELNTLLLAVVGFLFSISIRSPKVSYFVVVVAGFLLGKMLFNNKRKHQFASYLVAIGFFLGYIIGAFYVDRRMLLLISILSVIISYYVHDKRLI